MSVSQDHDHGDESREPTAPRRRLMDGDFWLYRYHRQIERHKVTIAKLMDAEAEIERLTAKVGQSIDHETFYTQRSAAWKRIAKQARRRALKAEAAREASRAAWERERDDLIGLLERWRDTDPRDDAAWVDILTDTLDVLAVTEEARAALGRPAGEGGR